MDVGGLVWRPVHLRVLLGPGQQCRDALAGLTDLVHHQLGVDGVPHPADGTLQQIRRAGDVVDCRRDPFQPVGVQTGLDERRREVPGARDAVVLEPLADLVLAVGGLQRSQFLRSWTWRPVRRPRPGC